MKKNKLLITIGAAVLVGIVSLLIYRAQNQSTSSDVVRIGAILPLTGAVSDDGAEALIGMELAIEELNDQGVGEKYVLNVKDGKFETKASLNAYNLLMSEGVDGIMAVGDVPCQMIQPLLKKDKKPTMAPMAASIQSINQSDWIFRSWTSIEHVGKLVGTYLCQTQVKKAVVFYIDTMYGIESRDAFKSAFEGEGRSVLAHESFPFLAADLRTSITKLLTYNPDVFYVTGFGPTYVVAINQLRELGYMGIIALDAAVVDPRVKKNIKNLDNIIFAGIALEDEIGTNELTKHFVAAYEKKTGRSVAGMPPQVPFSYFAVKTLANALTRHSSSDEVINALSKMQNNASIFGNFSYDEAGELYVPIYIRQFNKDGLAITIDKVLWKNTCNGYHVVEDCKKE